RAGETLSLFVTPGGDVEHSEKQEGRTAGGSRLGESPPPRPRPPFPPPSAGPPRGHRQDPLAPRTLRRQLQNLHGPPRRLPDWVRLPKSIALPFGTLDKVLADERNRGLRDECQTLITAAEENPSEALAHLREKVLQLAAPAELQTALLEQWQKAGLPPVP